MQLSLLLIQKIASFFIMIFCGVLLVRLKLLKSADSRLLSILTTYVFVPCVILNSFQVRYSAEKMRDLLILLLAAVAVHALYIGMTMLIWRPLKLNGTEQASLVYTNAGSLVLPLIAVVLGEDRLFFGSLFASLQVVVIWTHGRAVICGEKRFDWKKVFLNFNVIVMVVGFLMFLMQIRLPSVVTDALGGLGGMMSPACMLVIGMLIGETDLRRVFTDRHAILVSLLRLFAYPLTFLGLLRLTNLTRLTSTPDLLIATVLAASAPAASTIINIAQVGRADTQTAVAVNILSTLMCIVSMPVMVRLYQWLFL